MHWHWHTPHKTYMHHFLMNMNVRNDRKWIAHCLCFTIFCWSLIPLNSTYIPQGYFIGTAKHTIAPVPMKKPWKMCTVCPKKYAHGFGVLCFVVVMLSFIMNSHEGFIHIHQGCFVGTGAIVRLPQCQWSKPDGYGKISQCITTTKHSKAKTVCIFLGIYCITWSNTIWSSFHEWIFFISIM